MRHHQQGVTLITVLLLLIAITIIGSLTIRSSITSLKISTMSQAQQLMLQNSDAALFHIEDPGSLEKNMAINGMFGYIKGEDNDGKELVFCYRASEEDFFSLSKASLIDWNGSQVRNTELGSNGFCSITKGFFSTNRKTVMTQIAIKAADMSNVAPFSHMQEGTDPEGAKVDPAQLYTVYATTIFPALAPASVENSEIDGCFENHFNSIPSAKKAELEVSLTDPSLTNEEKAKVQLAQKTVSECLSDLGVPAHTQVARYALMQKLNKKNPV